MPSTLLGIGNRASGWTSWILFLLDQTSPYRTEVGKSQQVKDDYEAKVPSGRVSLNKRK